MAKRRRAATKKPSKFQTVKSYYRLVCGKRQLVKAHNKKRPTKKRKLF